MSVKDKICRSAWMKCAWLPSVKKSAFNSMFPDASFYLKKKKKTSKIILL